MCGAMNCFSTAIGSPSKRWMMQVVRRLVCPCCPPAQDASRFVRVKIAGMQADAPNKLWAISRGATCACAGGL